MPEEGVVSQTHLYALTLLLAMGLSPAPLIAQQATAPGTVAIMDTMNRDRSLKNHWWVSGKVTTIEGDPIQGAAVEVEPLNAAGEFRSFSTTLQGLFQTDYWLQVDIFKEFDVTLTVSKKGFRKAQETVALTDPSQAWIIPITLRAPVEDPRLLAQADLIARLTPRLKALGASDKLSAAEEKDYARGVEEFLSRKRPDLALAPLTKVTRQDPSCVQCRAMLALAELDSSDWDGAYRNLMLAGQTMRDDTSLGRPEPLIALGVMETWRRHPSEAAGVFLEALKYAPQNPLALQELGRSQVLTQNWEAAEQSFSKALAAGAGPEARLLLAEALLGGDHTQAASTALTRYLAGREVRTMPFEVRQLWVQIENRKKLEAAYIKGQPKGEAAIDHYLRRPPPDLKGLEPAADQAPLASILSGVGKSVAEFFKDFPNTVSLEEIHQEKLGRKQKGGETLERKFRYLCATPAKAWGPGFDEFREELPGAQTSAQALEAGFMLTSGFASASLVFHPLYQAQADFRYLGRQKIDGRNTNVIAFAQEPGKARLHGAFKFRDLALPTFTQGLAWIDSATYEIVRLRTDLLAPLAEVKLERQTTEIAFAKVEFKSIGREFELPQQVTVNVDWNGKHLQNEHRYSDFRLFNVEAVEKRKPNDFGEASKEASKPQTPP